MTEATRLCAVADVPPGGTAALVTELAGKRVQVMAIRKGADVFVYKNSCPHIGGPLDYPPGKFLTDDGRHIQCYSHYALFRIEDGLCVEGPCKDDRLTQIKAEIRGADVYLLA